jgi:hypothetical protein
VSCVDTMERPRKTRSISDYLLFARVFLFAAAVPALMRLKISRLAMVLEPGSEPRPIEASRVQKISAYTHRAIRMGKPLVRPGCLTLGLTRYHFFRRAGMDVSLHFGVGRIGAEKEFVGHCWLTRDGQPYLESVDPRPLYVEMYRISPQGAWRSMAVEANGLSRLIHS